MATIKSLYVLTGSATCPAAAGAPNAEPLLAANAPNADPLLAGAAAPKSPPDDAPLLAAAAPKRLPPELAAAKLLALAAGAELEDDAPKRPPPTSEDEEPDAPALPAAPNSDEDDDATPKSEPPLDVAAPKRLPPDARPTGLGAAEPKISLSGLAGTLYFLHTLSYILRSWPLYFPANKVST